MHKKYIIRQTLYEEEDRPEKGIPQQVCVMVKFDYKPMDIYEIHREGGLYFQDELLQKNAITSGISSLIIYVRSEVLALDIAERWCNEPDQKKEIYRVEGIDKYYSVFD